MICPIDFHFDFLTHEPRINKISIRAPIIGEQDMALLATRLLFRVGSAELLTVRTIEDTAETELTCS